jgi:hypothetical protein
MRKKEKGKRKEYKKRVIFTLWLDIAVNEVVFMAVVNSRHNLAEETSRLPFINPVLVRIADHLEKFTPSSMLHDQHKAVLALNYVIKNSFLLQSKGRGEKEN